MDICAYIHTYVLTYVRIIYLYAVYELLLCRGHTYRFDDFLASWMDRLKDGLDGEHTTVTVRLQKEVDKYQVSQSICDAFNTHIC